MSTPLDRLYELIDDIEIAMMTTRRADGHLRSRAMATQKQAPGADLWFVARDGTGKLREIEGDPHVNLSYIKSRTMAWISVSGVARLSRDRATIAQLHEPDWAMWFPDEGDPRHGTPDDPRMVLIGVTVHAAEFLDVDSPTPAVLFELARGWLTGTEPDVGQMHALKAPHRPTSA